MFSKMQIIFAFSLILIKKKYCIQSFETKSFGFGSFASVLGDGIGCHVSMDSFQLIDLKDMDKTERESHHLLANVCLPHPTHLQQIKSAAFGLEP